MSAAPGNTRNVLGFEIPPGHTKNHLEFNWHSWKFVACIKHSEMTERAAGHEI